MSFMARGLPRGHPKVDVVRQHEPQYVRRRSQPGQIDLRLDGRRGSQREKVKQELSKQIPHLEGLRILLKLLALLLGHPAKVGLVKRAIVVLALIDVVFFAFLDLFQRLFAVRAAKDRLLGEPISVVEPALAHFALVLPFSAVIGVQVRRGSLAARAGQRIRNTVFRIRAALDGPQRTSVLGFVVRQQLPVIKGFRHIDDRKVIDLKFSVRLLDRFVQVLTIQDFPTITPMRYTMI
ncbi:hypothetical protein GK0992 [Geobacillus kaustophilus HTA426]|uniref:Uncharacterized protein n=1 Tax=Geobacillus kaustophilus (strain HTA426) TaxID=235909 RepID=Q5L1A3_GEOKA|nr:hypothetical protein GK0992 [Geobacillus kaustophilus HTA426]